MALQDNNLMLLDIDVASPDFGLPRTIANTDSLAIGVDTAFGADLSVGGNLTVTGDIISSGAMDVVVTDNFIDLSNGQVNGSNKAGGLTVNVQSAVARVSMTNATFQDAASSGTGFATVSIPGFDPSTGGFGGASLADGDIIEIAGCTDLAGNNGLFVVESVAAGVAGLISIKNASQTQSPWAQTNFESGQETAAGASFAPSVDLGVFCISDGALLDIGGNPIPVGQFVSAFATQAKLSNIVYEAAANVSLQEAYTVGQQILLSDSIGAGNLTIRTDDTGARADFLLQNEAGTQAYLATSAGSLQVGDGATIKVNMAGQVSSDIVFDGVGARSITQAGADLSLSTTGAANTAVSSAAQVNLDSGDDSRFAMAANDANPKALVFLASNAGAGVANLVLQADDTVQASGADLSAVMANQIDLNSQGAALNALVMQAPNGGMDLTSNLDMDLVSITGAVKAIAQAGGVLVESNNSDLVIDAKGAKVDIDGATGVTMSAAAGGFQIDGTGAASSVQSSGSDLSVATVVGGNLILDSAGNVSSTAATNWGATATGGDLSLGAPAGAASMIANTSATIEGGAQVILRSTNADLDIDASTSIAIDSGAATAITAGSAFAAAAGAGNATLTATGGLARVASTDQGVEMVGATTADVRALGGNLTLSHNDAASRLVITTQGTGAGAGSEALSLSSQGAAIMESQQNLILQSNTADIEGNASGSIMLNAANDSEFLVTGAGQSLLLESQGGSLDLRADTGLGHFVTLDGKIMLAKDVGVGVGSLAAAALNPGEVVFASSGTEVNKADRTNADCPIGIVMEGGAAPGDDVFIHTVHGAKAKTDLNAVAGDVGKFLYLDANGAMTMTAPVASGDYVWRLGCIVGIDTNKAVIMWAPQFIAKRP